jgi:flagellar hook assembly protein FlgD
LGNYPNPFNPSTTISYTLPYQSSVELVIYDIMGAKVKSFSIPSQSSGYQSILWNGRNENGNPIASGIYLYRISIKSLENNETFVKSAKLLMLK